MTEQERPQFFFSTYRGLRSVPLDWKHPRDTEDGTGFKPLFPRNYFTDESFEEYLEEDPNLTREEFESWHMPDFSDIPEERMGICAYETTTEGTPISPVFPNTPEGRFAIVKHCAENQTVFADQKADVETWAAMLFGKNHAMFNLNEGRIEIFDSRQNTEQ